MLRIGSTQDGSDILSFCKLHSPSARGDGDQFVASIFDVPKASAWGPCLLSAASPPSDSVACKSPYHLEGATFPHHQTTSRCAA